MPDLPLPCLWGPALLRRVPAERGRLNDPERCGQVDKVSEPPKDLERRALEVAARVMEAAGLCRHRDRAKCQRLTRSPEICEKCLAAWCMTKARKLTKEEKDHALC